MSYTFLRATGEESSAECFAEIPPCALSRSSPTAVACCCSDSGTASSHVSPCGTTCEHSTDGRGAASPTWYLADFRARTSASPRAPETGSTASAADSGPKWRESFAKYDPELFAWRTRQHSLLGGLEEFSATWPEWGTMRDGECWALKTPEAIMRGEGSGSLPTPTATEWKGGTTAPQKRNGLLRTHQLRHWCKILHGLTYPIPEHLEAMMGLPIGWSAPAPLATDRFQAWLRSHGAP